MNLTSISLSYFFLGIGIISLIFFLYFKYITVKTSDGNDSREKIIGKMKDPDSWISRNKTVSYLSFFWFIVSTLVFIYLKYFKASSLISILYLIIYLAVVILSLAFVYKRPKAVS